MYIGRNGSKEIRCPLLTQKRNCRPQHEKCIGIFKDLLTAEKIDKCTELLKDFPPRKKIIKILEKRLEEKNQNR